MNNCKTARLNVRLSSCEQAKIKRRAEGAGLTVSEYARRRLLNDNARPVIDVDTGLLKELYRNFRIAGGNLNQVARELNTHHRPNQIEDEIARAACELAAASAAVSGLVEDVRNNV